MKSVPSARVTVLLGLLAAVWIFLLAPPRAAAQIGPGQAYHFGADAGSSMRIKEVSLPPPWTVELWVRRSDSPAPSAPLFINAVSALKLEQFGTDRHVGFTRFGDKDYDFAYSAPTSRWEHLAFVGTATEMRLYTNGTLQGVLAGTMSLPMAYFGRAPSVVSDQLAADVDELRVWQVARTTGEIRQGMNHRLHGDEPGFVALFQAEETSKDKAENQVSKDTPVGNGTSEGVSRVPSGALFAPELDFRFAPSQFNTTQLQGGVNPGNLPTDVRFFFGSALPLSNAPPAVILSPTNRPFAVNRSVPFPPEGGIVAGQIVASNAAGVSFSTVQQAWAPLIYRADPTPLTNECHEPMPWAGSRARIAVVGVAAGDRERAFLQADGRLTHWTDNLDTHEEPVVEPGRFIQVSAGEYATAALRVDGSIAVWARVADSPLGTVPEKATPAIAVSAGSGQIMALTSGRNVVVWGNNIYGEVNVPTDATNVIAISAGALHCLALTSSGRVIAWGDNTEDQLDVPAEVTNVVAIAAGTWHSAALRADGTVVTWGRHGYSYYAVPPGVSNIVQISVGSAHTMARRADGRVFTWGMDAPSEDSTPPEAQGARSITAGSESAFALMPDGGVVAWGELNAEAASLFVGAYEGIPSDQELLDTTVPGLTFLAHSITNEFGIFRREYPVQIIDTRPPSLQLIGDSTLSWYPNTPFLDPGVLATDTCDTLVQVVTHGSVDTARPGTYTLTYTATDASGNRTDATRRVIIPPSPYPAGDVNADGVVDERDLAFVLDRLHGTGRMTEADLHVALDRYYAGSAWVGMTNVMGLGGSNVVFTLLNGPGALGFQVDTSTDLIQWRPLGIAVPRYEFLDTNPPAAGLPRAYRLRWP